MNCQICQAILEESAHYCHQCGNAVDGEQHCQSCGFQIESKYRFCPNCGKVLSDLKYQDSLGEKLSLLENEYQNDIHNYQLAFEIANLKIYLGDYEAGQRMFDFLIIYCQESALLFKTYYRYGRMLSGDNDITVLQKSIDLLTKALEVNPVRSETAMIEVAINRIKNQVLTLQNNTQI